MNANLSTLLKEADEQIGILSLYTGSKMDGTPYYAYALIRPSKYQEYVKKCETGNFRLTDYGDIIVSGNRGEPHEAVRKKIEQEYNANPNFTDALRQSLQKFVDKTEARDGAV